MSGRQADGPLQSSAGRRSAWRWTLPLLLVAFSSMGCRAPWQPARRDGEPDFDRLIELERRQSRAPAFNPVNARRPGSSDDHRLVSRVDDAKELKPHQGSEGGELDEQELLARTERALQTLGKDARSSDDTGQADQPQADTSAEGSQRATSRSSGEADEDQAVVFRLNDEGSSEASRSAAGGQSSGDKLAEYTSTEDDKTQSNTAENADSESSSATSNRGKVVPASAEKREDKSAEVELATNRQPPATELGWRDHLREAIKHLEDAPDDTLSEEDRLQRQVVTRMLHLSLRNVEAAVEPIKGLDAREQDYFRHQFQALHHAIDPDGSPLASRRWSLAMLSQRKASENLKAVSNLEVKNVAFCTEVESFGVITKFSNYRFAPDQEVLLYCELDNFVSVKKKEEYETQLQGAYEIFDSNGRRVADQELPLDTHHCRNQRRDYYIPYRIYMPKNISPGDYVLRLVIEDAHANKFGQADLEFKIVE